MFGPGGASVEIAGGETIALDPPLSSANETIGTYVELDAGAQIEIATLTVDEPHASSEDLGPPLRELAAAFHGWYNTSQFLVDDADLRDARLALAAAVRQALANGLELLGVSAPESM